MSNATTKEKKLKKWRNSQLDVAEPAKRRITAG